MSQWRSGLFCDKPCATQIEQFLFLPTIEHVEQGLNHTKNTIQSFTIQSFTNSLQINVKILDE